METIREVAAPFAVLVLLGAVWWFFRNRPAGMRTAAGRRLELLERLALTPQHTLYLVRMGERTLLLASSPGGCVLIESRREDEGVRAGVDGS